MKIMIVDDNLSMREVVKSYIPSQDVDFIQLCDGDKAIETYEKEKPDWVIMDIRMEHIDGLTATKEIKALHPEAKIIILTQYDDVEFRTEAERLGAYEYVLKDHLEKLRRIIMEV